MQASITELRYKTKQILKAVDRRETVELTFHGKVRARIVPVEAPKKRPALKDDPFVGMGKDDMEPVESIMNRLRAPRYHGL
jgi:prevent-host-death family protein